MQPEKKIRIALLGPESTGKTTLAEQLAGYYNTTWAHEYSREYAEKHSLNLKPDDFAEIGEETRHRILAAEKKANKIVFCDTEFIYLKVWCESWFMPCPEEIRKYIEEVRFDLFLLTEPDIAWVPDFVRENPDERDALFELYKKEVEEYGFMYETINGIDNQRFENAKFFIEKHFPHLR